MRLPTVLIPAAGQGTRIQDIALDKPKPIVTVCGKPVISWIIDSLMKQGFNDFSLAVPNRSKIDPTAKYIRSIYSGLIKYNFTQQKHQLGPLHALYVTLPFIESEGVLVILSDTICFETMSAKNFNESWVFLSEVRNHQPWCLAQVNNNCIERFYDKPSTPVDTNLALIGVYYFHDKNYFLHCAQKIIRGQKKINNEYQISSAIELYQKKYTIRPHITPHWLDCGSVESLRKTSNSLISEKSRAFNQLRLSVESGTIEKKAVGFGAKTLENEINFYLSIPEKYRPYFPRVLKHKIKPSCSKIVFEYWPLSNLADIFIYNRYSEYMWSAIIENIAFILRQFRLEASYKGIKSDTFNILWEKTQSRIDALVDQNFKLADLKEITLNKKPRMGWHGLAPILKERIELMSKAPVPSILHGDMCFSNILSDKDSGIIKLIDPRGRFGKRVGTRGDQRYDLAKLRQSYHGNYDFIVNDLYQLTEKKTHHYNLKIFRFPYHDAICQSFDSKLFKSNQASMDETLLIEGLLFISMCPLHYEDRKRQQALWLRGIELLNTVINNMG